MGLKYWKATGVTLVKIEKEMGSLLEEEGLLAQMTDSQSIFLSLFKIIYSTKNL
jgi:hypothetical protein